VIKARAQRSKEKEDESRWTVCCRRPRTRRQDDSAQTVRVWGDTAIVTAKLWSKGTDADQPFEHQLWFSDVYIRTPAGWRYAFGQASLPLAKLQQEQK
jgi:hypothetical protein